MKNKLFKESERVKVFLDGGWEIEGLVIDESEKKLMLKDLDGDTVVVLKKKMSAVKVLKQEASTFVRGNPYMVQPLPSAPTPQPEIQEKENKQMVFSVSKGKKQESQSDESKNPYYYESGLSIPLGVMDGRPPGVTISIDDDFHMSMEQLKSIGSGAPNKKINFVVEKDE